MASPKRLIHNASITGTVFYAQRTAYFLYPDRYPFLLQPRNSFEPKRSSLPSLLSCSGGHYGVFWQTDLLSHIGNAKELFQCFILLLIMTEPTFGMFVIESQRFIRALLLTPPTSNHQWTTTCRSNDSRKFRQCFCCSKFYFSN